MFKDLLPIGLQNLLWSLQGKISTIQILSDEPHIPWEVLKLRTKEAGQWKDGPYLCEAFAVTRWLRGIPEVLEFPMSNIALVVPKNSQLPNAMEEKSELLAFASPDRRVSEIEARFTSIAEAFKHGSYDSWHFSGHGKINSVDPNSWELCLDDNSALRPEDLNASLTNLGVTHPLVFLNSCHSGKAGFSLAGAGGWSKQLLDLGVGAFIGTHWVIEDQAAKEFARVFYSSFFSGLPIAESVRRARSYLHVHFPGDASWLAYTVFAHPGAICPAKETIVPELGKGSPLIIPDYRLCSDNPPPSSLLRAECSIVPFHGRAREIQDLVTWCSGATPALARLYIGNKGAGKTRMALELAKQLRAQGWWAGIPRIDDCSEELWKLLLHHTGKILLIIDNAEVRRGWIISLIQVLKKAKKGLFRLLLLAQTDLDWWELLITEGNDIGAFLRGPSTSKHSLVPLTLSIPERTTSYQIALEAFSNRLNTPIPPRRPNCLDAKLFENTLMLHMRALMAVKGFEEVADEDELLDQMLQEENRYLQTCTAASGLPLEVIPQIRRALAALALTGGAESQMQAIALLKSLDFFANEPDSALAMVVNFLRTHYRFEHWEEPLLPELLGERLAECEIASGGHDLLKLILGTDTTL